jgi:hypothetical protein
MASRSQTWIRSANARETWMMCSWLIQYRFIDYFLKTMSSGKLWTTLSEDMSGQFQCMTFWYTFYYCTGMSFYSTQEFASHAYELQMNHTLADVEGNVQWVFGEMPLKRFHGQSKVSTPNLWLIELVISMTKSLDRAWFL